MFMLVFAGWQWLMAAGRADQITKAKDTIVGVLVGLVLLFGSGAFESESKILASRLTVVSGGVQPSPLSTRRAYGAQG